MILMLCFALISSIQLLAQELYFPPNFSEEWEAVSLSELSWCEENIDDFNVFLEETNTNACIILKDGKMAHEAYFNEFETSSNWYWASAGKSLTAAMVGILQEEEVLNIDDLTSDYLGQGWTGCSLEDENKITIRNQLTMTTGLDYTVEDIYCIEPECLFCLNEPGQEWYYHNAPYTLLADVMEAAMDQNYTGLTNDRLTNKIGFVGLWTKVNTGRLFFSTARGMARFGLLMLNEGDWDGEVILKDKAYLQAMINTSQEINKAYGYLWWLNGKESYRLPGSTFTFPGSIIPNAPDDLYAALGKNGQILIVVPSQNLIIVRMGDNPDNSLVPTAYVNDLWNEYQKLTCAVSTQQEEELEYSIHPKLVFNEMDIVSDENFDIVNIFDLKGNKIISSKAKTLELGDLSSGVYFVQVIRGKRTSIQKIIKL
jgi:CubicO group peptidase (beta-lactamase class C family)